MTSSTYLKPKVAVGNIGKQERKRGEFVNVGSYPELGGFSSAQKRKPHDPPMTLEKGGPSSKKGKPI